jgi:hypothetical protein
VDKTSATFTTIAKLLNEPTNNAASISKASIIYQYYNQKLTTIEGHCMTDQLAWGLIDTIQNAAKLNQYPHIIY